MSMKRIEILDRMRKQNSSNLVWNKFVLMGPWKENHVKTTFCEACAYVASLFLHFFKGGGGGGVFLSFIYFSSYIAFLFFRPVFFSFCLPPPPFFPSPPTPIPTHFLHSRFLSEDCCCISGVDQTSRLKRGVVYIINIPLSSLFPRSLFPSLINYSFLMNAKLSPRMIARLCDIEHIRGDG